MNINLVKYSFVLLKTYFSHMHYIQTTGSHPTTPSLSPPDPLPFYFPSKRAEHQERAVKEDKARYNSTRPKLSYCGWNRRKRVP